jgi:hypothetical protein
LHWAQGRDPSFTQPAFTASGYKHYHTAANAKIRPETPRIVDTTDRPIAHDCLLIIVVTGLALPKRRQIHFTALVGVGNAQAFKTCRIGQKPVRAVGANYSLVWGLEFDFTVKNFLVGFRGKWLTRPEVGTGVRAG